MFCHFSPYVRRHRLIDVQQNFRPRIVAKFYIIYIQLNLYNLYSICKPAKLMYLPGGGALECNLTGRCPFCKNVHNPYGKKIAFQYPVS